MNDYSIIIVSGMIRSGSTLHYQIVKSLYEYLGIRINTKYCNSIDELQEFITQCKKEDKKCIAKIHFFSDEIEEMLRTNNCKCLYIHRNILDVASSLVRKTNHDISYHTNSLKTAIQGRVFYSNTQNTLVSDYETMMESLEQEVAKIANFLFLDVDKNIVNKITSDLSLENQKNRIETQAYQKHFLGSSSVWETGKDLNGSYILYNDISLLHKNHITSDGMPGRWKDVLSQEEVKEILFLEETEKKRIDFKNTQEAI